MAVKLNLVDEGRQLAGDPLRPAYVSVFICEQCFEEAGRSIVDESDLIEAKDPLVLRAQRDVELETRLEAEHKCAVQP